MRFIGSAYPGGQVQGDQSLRMVDVPLSFGPQEHAPAPTGRVDWATYWRSVRKRRWLILALAAVATVAAMLYAQGITPIYRSTSTMLIESGKTKILSIEEVYNGISQDREYYQTQVEILRSHEVAMRTVVATKLWEQPEFDPRKPARSLQGKIKDFFNPPPEPPPWTAALLAEATVGKFLGAVSIEPVRLSQLVKISFEAADKELAARVADAVASSYIGADRDARLKLNLSVNGLLQDRMVALRERLLASEEELQKFRESSGLVSVSGSQGIAGLQLTDLGQRLVSARVRRTELESTYQQVERIGDGDFFSLPTSVQPAGLSEARNRVSVATAVLGEVTRTLGDQHTRVIEARSNLAAAQKDLQIQIKAAVASLRRETAAARQTERALVAALGSARSAVQGVNRQEFQLGVLEREVQANRQLYELFLSRAKETGISNNLQSAAARIVDSARPATAPLRPNKPQIVMAAFLFALLASAGASVALDKLGGTLQGSAEAESQLNHPVLTSLPTAARKADKGGDSTFLHAPKSHHADAIRKARTNIVLSNMMVAHKVMLVTSAVDGEGKTAFCTDLAYALAQAKRTLVIDCDFRNPQLGSRLGLPAQAKGIGDLVMGNAELKDCVHAVPGSTLLAMPAGDVPDNPEEFLLSPRFRDALRSLSNRVEIVLIDSPAVDTGSDALIIAQQANETIYVVKARDTSSAMAQKGLEQLRRAGASIMGIVLTNTDTEAVNVVRRVPPGYGQSRNASSVLDT